MPGVRVSESKRNAIRMAYEFEGGTYLELAIRFDVSESTVKRCCKGLSPVGVSGSVESALKDRLSLEVERRCAELLDPLHARINALEMIIQQQQKEIQRLTIRHKNESRTADTDGPVLMRSPWG